MSQINKETFILWVKELGMTKAIAKVRAELGAGYTSAHIAFDKSGRLSIKRLANRTKSQKPKSQWRLNVKRKRKIRRQLTKVQK